MKKKVEITAPTKVQLVDMERSKRVEMFLRRGKISGDELRVALCEMDHRILSRETITNFLNVTPEESEWNSIKVRIKVKMRSCSGYHVLFAMKLTLE